MTDKNLKIYSIMIAVIVVLSVVGNMIYASFQVVSEPLFAATNKEFIYNENFNDSLNISYITNNSDKRRLESISFEGLESIQHVSQGGYYGGFVFTNGVNDNPYNDLIGRYYTLKNSEIDLNLTTADIKRIEEDGSLSFGSGTAKWDDGTTIPVSLGRLTIYTNEHWAEYNMKDGANGSYDHFNGDYKTKAPIKITSLDLSSFERHKEALDLEFIVDHNKVYSYAQLMINTKPILVERSFQIVFAAKNSDVSSQWRFNKISMNMTYEKDGQAYDAWIYSPFNGIGRDEASVEAFVEFWRVDNE